MRKPSNTNKPRVTARVLGDKFNPDIHHGIRVNSVDEVRAALSANPSDIMRREAITQLPPLHMAVGFGNKSMVVFLLQQPGLNLLEKDEANRDALDLALIVGHQGIVNTLFPAFEALAKQRELYDPQENGPSGNVVPLKPS